MRGDTVRLQHGARYRATLSLSFFQRMASNDTIAQKLRDVGFTSVGVSGSGRSRTAVGTWGGPDREVDLPSAIDRVELV